MKLTEDYVKSLTYPEYFERGVQYYKDGLVEIVVNNEDMVKANVYGSKKYKITIDKNDLECECNCPAYSYKHNCKHVVAVMLCLINKKTASKKNPIRGKINKKISKTKKQMTGTKFDKATKIVKEIKTLVRGQGKYWGNWRRYTDEQIRIANMGYDLLEKIKLELEVLTVLLDLAKWYDKELEKIDDSDGTNQELQMNIVFKAAECGLGNSPSLVFEKVKPYLEYKSSFDYGDLILQAFFEVKRPNKIAEYLGEYCQKKGGGLWQRCKEYWCRYLKQTKDPRFETEARKYFSSNINILVLLIEYYGKTRQIDKAVDVGWGKRYHFMVSDLLVKLLKKEKDYQHLSILLKERLVKDWDKKEARLLKSALAEIGKVDEWKTFIDNLVVNIGSPEIKLEMLMFLKRYAEVAEIVIKTENWPFINAEDYAVKLTILDEESAKRIYWHLVLKEEKKFERSNYYKNFWKFIGALRKIESQKKIKNYLSEIEKKYPKKQKLVEAIERFT